MIDNDEARKTWDEIVNVAKQPLVKAIETEAYFEQFRGDDPIYWIDHCPKRPAIQKHRFEWEDCDGAEGPTKKLRCVYCGMWA